MATYSAALLKVTDLTAIGSSAALNAVKATVTNLNATDVTVDNLDFGTLDISGNFNVTGFNEYEGSYAAGDVVSYVKKGTMTATQGNAFWAEYLGPSAAAFVPSTTYDIDFYEMVYWGVDARSGSVSRMSATVCVPSTIVDTTLVSYKHGTLINTYEYSTLWQSMQNIVATGKTGTSYAAEGLSWIFATTGYVTVVSDNPAYGVSVGFYNFTDPLGESESQYNALVALTQLTQKAPELFNATFTAPYNVINSGYSLGGLFTPVISQLIGINPNLVLKNTIAGAPPNVNKLLLSALYDSSGNPSSQKTSLTIYILSLLITNTNPVLYADTFGLNDSIKSYVLPMFNPLYLNTVKNIGTSSTDFFGRIITFTQLATAGQALVDASGAPYFSLSQGIPYVIPNKILNAPNGFLNVQKQVSFYTNRFVDYADLSGTPVNVLYSLQDELCCYNPATPYLGSPTTDNVNDDLSAFITTSAPLLNGLKRTEYENIILTSTPTTLASDITANVIRLLNSESTNKCSNYRYNTAGVGNLDHTVYTVTVFQTVIRNYLKNRPSS